MRRAKQYAFRPNSKPCSKCEDLRRLKVRIEAALRNARSLYAAATDTTSLQSLEEELKQTSAAHKLICFAVRGHLADQHSETRGVRLAA